MPLSFSVGDNISSQITFSLTHGQFLWKQFGVMGVGVREFGTIVCDCDIEKGFYILGPCSSVIIFAEKLIELIVSYCRIYCRL